MLETLDAPAVRLWSRLAADAFDRHRAEIDALNVYPVPDADTGTNIALTMHAAADALAADGATGAGEALQRMARGAVLGARGNSGVIVAQILCGLADGVGGAESWDGATLQGGLRLAADQAYAAVAQPVEGTILTVARAAADSAGRVCVGMGEVALAAVSGAAAALARTPLQLPVLARAGVVDAGGRGLVVLLDCLARLVNGRDPARDGAPPPAPVPPAVGGRAGGYELQFLISTTDIEGLRARLIELGDSLVLVRAGAAVWNVHVHVHDVGAAFEAAVQAGRPSRISVVRLADGAPNGLRAGTTIVAVAPGAGLAHLFEAEGVRVVDDGRESEHMLAVILSAGTGQVVLLPNDAAVAAAVESAARQARGEGIDVAVVPTHSPVQGLAAVAVHDPRRRFGDDVVAMAEAAAATRWAEIIVAARDALTSVGPCRAGDVLGLIDGEVVEIGVAVEVVARAVLLRLLGIGAELVTIVLGEDARAGLGGTLARFVAESAQGVETTVYDGGQPDCPLLLGVE